MKACVQVVANATRSSCVAVMAGSRHMGWCTTSRASSFTHCHGAVISRCFGAVRTPSTATLCAAGNITPDDAAATGALCPRTTKQKQIQRQDELAEDVAHIFGRNPTFHELSLFRVEGEPLQRIDDHGYMYGITEEDLEGCSDAVRRAVSTHVAGVPEAKRFRLSQVVDKFKLAEFDTGSSRVQVAVLTEHIKAMTEHMVAHPHDKHAKRALERYLVRRRKLLRYMMRKDYNNYRIVLRELGLRPSPLFYSKYPPKHLSRTRTPHKDIHARRKRIANPKRRGHKGH